LLGRFFIKMLDLLKKTKEICQILEIKPARSKGQNFLVNNQIYEDIIKAADLNLNDEVLEVGPGLGFLTVKLAKKAKRVVAVELDKKLADYLLSGFGVIGQENVEIIQDDVLRFNPQAEFLHSYKIVANLPYNISSIFLRQFLSAPKKPGLLVLMLQKEVAERIVAAPGEMNLLAVSVQHYCEAEIIREVRATNFWPVPEVDSAVIRMKTKTIKFSVSEDKLFFRLVKAGFSAKRKMLKNNLRGGLVMDSNQVEKAMLVVGLNNQIRAEDLSLLDWYKLFAQVSKFMV